MQTTGSPNNGLRNAYSFSESPGIVLRTNSTQLSQPWAIFLKSAAVHDKKSQGPGGSQGESLQLWGVPEQRNEASCFRHGVLFSLASAYRFDVCGTDDVFCILQRSCAPSA